MDSRRPDDANIDIGQEATEAVSEGGAVPGAVTEGGAATAAAEGVAEGGATTASAAKGVAQEAGDATEQVAEGATGAAGKVLRKLVGLPTWLEIAVAGALLLLALLYLVFGRRGART